MVKYQKNFFDSEIQDLEQKIRQELENINDEYDSEIVELLLRGRFNISVLLNGTGDINDLTPLILLLQIAKKQGDAARTYIPDHTNEDALQLAQTSTSFVAEQGVFVKMSRTVPDQSWKIAKVKQTISLPDKTEIVKHIPNVTKRAAEQIGLITEIPLLENPLETFRICAERSRSVRAQLNVILNVFFDGQQIRPNLDRYLRSENSDELWRAYLRTLKIHPATDQFDEDSF